MRSVAVAIVVLSSCEGGSAILPRGAGFGVELPLHGFGASWDGGATTLEARGGEAVTLSLLSWGRQDRQLPGEPRVATGRCPARGPLPAGGTCLGVVRDALTEWWEVRPEGLEHVVVLATEPAGLGPVALDFALVGARAVARGPDALELVPRDGRAWVYGGLWVVDALGRALPARFDPTATGFRIEIDERGATWPLTIDPLVTVASASFDSDEAGAQFGSAIAVLPDQDGDGIDDLVVGAPTLDVGSVDEGAVLGFGSSIGGPLALNLSAESGDFGARLGDSVAGGDLDGDGFGDLVAGASKFTSTQADEGRVAAWFGPTAGGLLAGWAFDAGQGAAALGTSVAVFDMDQDTYADVLAGAPAFDGPLPDDGAAFFFRGGPTGPGATPDVTLTGTQADAEFGYRVALVGDLDGDGYGEAIVTAPAHDDVSANEGAVFVFSGSASGPSTAPSFSAFSGQLEARLGDALTTGDFDGDGDLDLAVGAPQFDQGQNGEGAVFVWWNGPGGFAASPDLILEGGQVAGKFGFALASGDTDCDGMAELLVGAREFDGAFIDEGAAFLFPGTPTGLSTVPSTTLFGGQASAHFGHAVAMGQLDLVSCLSAVVGAPHGEDLAAENNEGLVFFHPGCPDSDGDGVADSDDNCVGVANASQSDADLDGRGDLCDGLLLTVGSVIAGQSVSLTAELALPGETVTFVVSPGGIVPNAPCPAALGGLCLDVGTVVKKAGSAVADAAGVATTSFLVPASAAPGATVTFQAVAVRGGVGSEKAAAVDTLVQ